jgi:hypothetical protein
VPATIRAPETISSARLSVFAIAVASGSVKVARALLGIDRQCLPGLERAVITPQKAPSTMTGVPIDEPMPSSRRAEPRVAVASA